MRVVRFVAVFIFVCTGSSGTLMLSLHFREGRERLPYTLDIEENKKRAVIGLLSGPKSVCAVNGRPNNQDDDDYDLTVAEPETGIQNDNYEYPETDDEDVEPEIPDPHLTTRPQDFIAKENETVKLPCQIENGDTLVSMWRKNNELIFQDSIKFNIGNNFKVENRSLVISNVGANETANYTCSIPLYKTDYLNVTHRLFVQTAPKVVSLRAQHDIVQLDSGKTLVLTCKAIGYPEPTIKWSKKGHRFDSEGEKITIENIGHNDAGDYQCLADNNIDPPAHQFIHIAVAHKPVVRVEKLTVNAEENLDTELICYVHAVPKADIVWQKDGLNVVSTERRHFKNYNHTHILQIKRIERSDFGVYTCTARNRVGKSDKNVTLTMYPSPAEHVKTHHYPDKNVLVWKLESKSPIIKYAVEYKKAADFSWNAAPHTPEVINPDGNIYTVNYTLANLPSGHYEVKLRSKNTYGWSNWSDAVKVKSVEHHPQQHHTFNEPLIPEQSTLREEIVYQPKPQDPMQNEVLITEKPKGMQTTQATVVEVPKEQHKENTEQKPHTQERQHQDVKEGNKPDGAAAMLPLISLLCIGLFSTIYSH